MFSLSKYLFSKGYRYTLHDKKLPGKPDIVLKKHKTAIIFGIEASNSEIIFNQIGQEFKILIGYLLIVVAVSPWIGGLALRLKYR